MKCCSCKRDIPENSIYCNWCGRKQLKERQPGSVRIPEPKQLPSGSWFIRLRVSGQDIPITEPTEALCRAKATAIKSGLIEAKRAPLTLSAAIDNYISSREAVLSPSTLRGYRTIQRTRFKPYMTQQLDRINWQKAVNAEAKVCSPKTLKNAFGFLHAVAAENGLEIAATLPAVPKHQKQWLTPEQLPGFVEAVRGTPVEIPALLALHSLRRSEIFGLRWENVDLQNRRLTVHGSVVCNAEGETVFKEQNKTSGSSRTVPILIPALLSALQACPDKTGFVVVGNIDQPYKRINRICEKHGLPQVGVHGLRHSFASLGYHLGLSEMEIMRLGGWEDYNTIHRIYAHLSELDADKAARKMADFYSG